tara:strand:+ start:376 stop:819 length:444 start_codon:yes stop_codon:yes gene_type:complete
MPIKSFRGKIANGGIDTILLHTNTGSTGYRITKFQTLPTDNYGTQNHELLFKIYKIPQTTADDTVDFSDQTLLGVSYTAITTSASYVEHIVFDNEIFNQDIYITMVDGSGNGYPGNYYIELEQIKLALDQNTVATLKDIKNIEQPSV